MSDIRAFRQSPRAPRDRFPYMFDGPNSGFEFYRGWMSVLVWACEEIDEALGEDKRNFRWTQIKEKFGGSRFYYWIDSASSAAVHIGSERFPLAALVDGDSTGRLWRRSLGRRLARRSRHASCAALQLGDIAMEATLLPCAKSTKLRIWRTTLGATTSAEHA
jgi:hypothetical protein